MPTLDASRLLTFSQDLLHAQGVPEDIARDVAEHLIESDRVGYASHGISILPSYHRSLQGGHVLAGGRAECTRDEGTRLAFDGHRGFGQHVGKTVIGHAITRAKEAGHCIVTLRDSHHLGRLGYYGEMTAAAGLVMLACVNVINRPPVVAPYGGAQARLTTNPLCFAVPLPGRPPLLVDMATSAIAANKARVLAARGEPAPPGALIDAQGQATDDPRVLLQDPPGALLPFGAHKGYALGVVAELLAGVLSEGGTIQGRGNPDGTAVNNMFALVLDPNASGDSQWRTHEASAFIDYLLACPPQPGVDRVQYPGEFEADNRQRNAETVPMDEATRRSLRALAADLGVAANALEG